MYKIKASPEDFIVREIPSIRIKDAGKYLICMLKKTNYTTLKAVGQIAGSIRMPLKNIGFAGNKDKKAVTYQFISIKNTNFNKIKSLELKDINLDFIGYSDRPVSLGSLQGNEFIITVRNLSRKQAESIEKKSTLLLMPNYFGPQRFSRNNKEIGKNIIKKNYRKAVELIVASNSDYNQEIKNILNKSPDYIASLKILPKRLLTLYISSYQSYLWNRTLSIYLQNHEKNISIPLIGFGTEFKNKEIEKIATSLIRKEKIGLRDFIIREIPNISSEGQSRKAFTEIKDLSIIQKHKDSIKINFKLSKGSYATVAISFLLNGGYKFL
ncbi:tRNA pseudouridine(13) synthase TruD [Candidatus Woesearchaeota archaeon]|nr:tRNA pseudouridine(13) synthase TruD [Candidatus Woesearchaeota archaeon]